jgi:hypothetical protein
MHSACVRLIAVFLSITGLSAGAMPAQAAIATLPATLDGAPATLGEATAFHCHDLGRTGLTCFHSAAARDRDAGRILSDRGRAGTLSPDGVTSTGYVVAYAAISYAGASVILSQDYANLGTIGWNDVISSYKVFVSPTGAFYENINYAGRFQRFCCFSNVPYVGDAYNDIFSSFDLP